MLLGGCRVRVEDLPLLVDPHVCELVALRDISVNGDRLNRRGFTDGRVRAPFYLLVRVCDVEGEGKARIALYDQAGVRRHESTFEFGEKDRFYSHVIFYERHADIPAGTYRVAVLINGRVLDERPLRIYPVDPGSDGG